MGQKVSPHGLRVGVIKSWESKWYADKKDFAQYIKEDNEIRKLVKKTLYNAGISRMHIERPSADKVRVIISTGKPGMVIGRSGEGTEQLKNSLVKLTKKEVEISIEEIKRAELDAQLTAESIAEALEKRIAFRRAMKSALGRTMKAGAKGIKIMTSGRLNGAEIARSEKYSEGNVPLHTIRADIDYGFAEADTTYGKLGIKVWINHGEVLDKGLSNTIREDKVEERKGKGRKGDGKGKRRTNGRNNRNGDAPRMPKAKNPRMRRTPKEEPAPEAPEIPTEENAPEVNDTEN